MIVMNNEAKQINVLSVCDTLCDIKKKKQLTAARAWLKYQTFTQHLKLCRTHKQSGLMASFIKKPVRIHKIIKWNTVLKG